MARRDVEWPIVIIAIAVCVGSLAFGWPVSHAELSHLAGLPGGWLVR